MRLSNQIVIASLNRGKFEEMTALFKAYPHIDLIQASSVLANAEKIGFAERHDTYLENAVAKARLVNQGCHYPTLSDDSGLECLALEGKPGVRSHRYATPKAGKSQDEANNELLIKELKGKSREAKFVCVLALVIEGIEITGRGELEGIISESPVGSNGFGYDPLFIPKGQGPSTQSHKSFAQMTDSEKNTISHRAKALQDLMGKVSAHGIVFAKP